MQICVATGSRAEYGLLKPLMEEVDRNPIWELQVLVTGTHLSPEFGLTYRQIEKDGFPVSQKVEMLLSSDTPHGIIKSMGLGMIGYADALGHLKPDLLIILGDRYEMLSLASAALIFRIPIAHLHGGEITEGAYDDSIRHAITKLSSLHFTAAESFRQRVIQLGECPETVFNVGAIGIDNIKKMKLLKKEELEEALNINFLKFNYQVTFHPETLSNLTAAAQFAELLKAIGHQEDSFVVFTKANADTDGRIINLMIDEYVSKNKNTSAVFDTLGTQKFLSLVKICDAIIGNSSSGIIEAPSLGTITINIGDRQKGRLRADSIIDCDADAFHISQAINQTKTIDHTQIFKSPYGDGQATNQIIDIIKSVDVANLLPKTFYNLT